MVERSGDLDLAEKPLGAEGLRDFRPEDLQRHRPVVLQVMGEIDGGHAAMAELPVEAVAVREGGTEAVELVRRGSPP